MKFRVWVWFRSDESFKGENAPWWYLTPVLNGVVDWENLPT